MWIWLIRFARFIPMLATPGGMKQIGEALKKFWKEFLIVTLFAIIGFGGWYHVDKTSDLKMRLSMSDLALQEERINYNRLDEELQRINNQIDDYVSANEKLADKLLDAQKVIDDLQARGPEVIIKTVYEQTLPEKCEAKFDWMIDEAIKDQEPK